MAVGNTFGATALSSYGGFWIAFAIVLTPGGFEIESSLEGPNGSLTAFHNSLSLFLWVRFISLVGTEQYDLTNIGLVRLHHYPTSLHP